MKKKKFNNKKHSTRKRKYQSTEKQLKYSSLSRNNVKLSKRTSNYRFNFSAISLIELENICMNMRKKKDYWRISTGILLDNRNAVGNILLKIISRSLETGIFREDWKEFDGYAC